MAAEKGAIVGAGMKVSNRKQKSWKVIKKLEEEQCQDGEIQEMIQSYDEIIQKSGIKVWAAKEGISQEFIPGAIKEEEQGWYLWLRKSLIKCNSLFKCLTVSDRKAQSEGEMLWSGTGRKSTGIPDQFCMGRQDCGAGPKQKPNFLYKCPPKMRLVLINPQPALRLLHIFTDRVCEKETLHWSQAALHLQNTGTAWLEFLCPAPEERKWMQSTGAGHCKQEGGSEPHPCVSRGTQRLLHPALLPGILGFLCQGESWECPSIMCTKLLVSSDFLLQ